MEPAGDFAQVGVFGQQLRQQVGHAQRTDIEAEEQVGAGGVDESWGLLERSVLQTLPPQLRIARGLRTFGQDAQQPTIGRGSLPTRAGLIDQRAPVGCQLRIDGSTFSEDRGNIERFKLPQDDLATFQFERGEQLMAIVAAACEGIEQPTGRREDLFRDEFVEHRSLGSHARFDLFTDESLSAAVISARLITTRSGG